jgi:hypothetical protein|nr:hypothetical protein [Neorhizobium tomejilense]
MYTPMARAIPSAIGVAGPVSAAEMTRGRVTADLSPAVFMGAAIAARHGISNDFVDPPGA